MVANLEKKLQTEIEKIGLTGDELSRVVSYLDLVKGHEKETYEHCLRAGLKFAQIAENFGLNQKLALYCGLLHDVGKIGIGVSLLKKRVGFNEEDYKIMRSHPMRSYAVLKHDFPLISLIVARHHYHQKNSYPATPPIDTRLGKKTNAIIEEYSKILAIVDFYDAISTRKDDAFGIKPAVPNQRKRKEELINSYPCKKEMIKELYRKKIFK